MKVLNKRLKPPGTLGLEHMAGEHAVLNNGTMDAEIRSGALAAEHLSPGTDMPITTSLESDPRADEPGYGGGAGGAGIDPRDG